MSRWKKEREGIKGGKGTWDKDDKKLIIKNTYDIIIQLLTRILQLQKQEAK